MATVHSRRLEGCRDMFSTVAQTPADAALFGHMLQALTPRPPDPSDPRSDVLLPPPPPTDLEGLRQELSQPAPKITHTHTQGQSRHTHQTWRRVNRVIREQGREKITEEQEETLQQSDHHSTLSHFQTTQDVDVFVTTSTAQYEAKFNEYTQNRELVGTSLQQWFQQLTRDVTALADSHPRGKGLLQATLQEWAGDARLDLWDKQLLVCSRFMRALWDRQEEQRLPFLQQVIWYSIDTFPDGPRKTLTCRWADTRWATDSIEVEVPEVLLRTFPVYTSMLHAFFVVKFVPFKQLFMKHRRERELAWERAIQTSEPGESTLDDFLDEEEQNGFRDPRFPEIDPRVCYCKNQ